MRVWAADVGQAQNLAVSSEMEAIAKFEIDSLTRNAIAWPWDFSGRVFRDLVDGTTYLPDVDDIQVVTG